LPYYLVMDCSWRIAALIDDELFMEGRKDRLEQTDYPESQC
jgi:hypothetical protein